VPRNKCVIWRTGFLPARYVRVRCLSGNPISLYSIQVLGIPISRVHTEFNADFWHMCVDKTVKNLFQPVLPPKARIADYAQLEHARTKGEVRFTSADRVEYGYAPAAATIRQLEVAAEPTVQQQHAYAIDRALAMSKLSTARADIRADTAAAAAAAVTPSVYTGFESSPSRRPRSVAPGFKGETPLHPSPFR
jgi:hypothetical protein